MNRRSSIGVLSLSRHCPVPGPDLDVGSVPVLWPDLTVHPGLDLGVPQVVIHHVSLSIPPLHNALIPHSVFTKTLVYVFVTDDTTRDGFLDFDDDKDDETERDRINPVLQLERCRTEQRMHERDVGDEQLEPDQ